MGQFNRQLFTLFYSQPLDALDISNLGRSKVKRVMVPFTMADAPLLAHMASIQVSVVLRLNERDYYRDDIGAVVKREVSWRMQHARIEAVICGVEPDNGVNLNYGSPDWDAQKAWKHAAYLGKVIEGLRGTGVKVVSPGWTAQSISEDEIPCPGRATWAEICRHTYDLCDGCGHHEYQYGWRSEVDRLRLKFSLKAAQERWHKPLWVDELGVMTGSQVERMQAYIDVARMLETHPLGQRVEMLAPFVSNGNANGWDAGYLLRDPAAYDMLGAFLQGN